MWVGWRIPFLCSLKPSPCLHMFINGHTENFLHPTSFSMQKRCDINNVHRSNTIAMLLFAIYKGTACSRTDCKICGGVHRFEFLKRFKVGRKVSSAWTGDINTVQRWQLAGEASIAETQRVARLSQACHLVLVIANIHVSFLLGLHCIIKCFLHYHTMKVFVLRGNIRGLCQSAPVRWRIRNHI